MGPYVCSPLADTYSTCDRVDEIGAEGRRQSIILYVLVPCVCLLHTQHEKCNNEDVYEKCHFMCK